MGKLNVVADNILPWYFDLNWSKTRNRPLSPSKKKAFQVPDFQFSLTLREISSMNLESNFVQLIPVQNSVTKVISLIIDLAALHGFSNTVKAGHAKYFQNKLCGYGLFCHICCLLVLFFILNYKWAVRVS